MMKNLFIALFMLLTSSFCCAEQYDYRIEPFKGINIHSIETTLSCQGLAAALNDALQYNKLCMTGMQQPKCSFQSVTAQHMVIIAVAYNQKQWNQSKEVIPQTPTIVSFIAKNHNGQCQINPAFGAK